MNYQVLARKWRPHCFKDMVGQEPTLRMLSNALTQKRLHHAYLFTGTRGVGKTTLGRIFAKCLNCEVDVTATPCGNCAACQAIDQGKFLDLYEIDAASRTKVEDTRELLENVLYPPTQGRYKIYLIDEVHMLSNHSFNALLKTLEEPPAHVKFLLATTDPKRLPITILSRCLQFHLKRIQPEQIAAHLKTICLAENMPHELPALNQIAEAADGSMRDALSLLDQAIAYGHGKLDTQEVQAMLGCMAVDDLLPLFDALAEKDGKKLFEKLSLLIERAPDFEQVLGELTSLLHKIAFAQIVPEAKTFSDATLALAKRFTPEDIQVYYQIALLGRRDLAIAPTPQQGFEMTLLRMLAFKANLVAAAPAPTTTIRELTPPPAQSTHSLAVAAVSEPNTSFINAKETKALPDWREMLAQLGLSGMAHALASNCTLVHLTDSKIELALSENHRPMLNAKLQERIGEALSQHFKKPIELKINITTNDILTPIKQMQNEQKEHLDQATQKMMQDPKVQQLVEMYDATVEVTLLR